MNSKSVLYAIKKDGRKPGGKVAPWLMHYMDSGLKEYGPDGKLHEVYTCLWSEHMEDAKVFDNRDKAWMVAAVIGKGCVVVKVRSDHDENQIG